jgi:EpsI family protein
LLALVLVTLVAYRATVASLFYLWARPGGPYQHGFVLIAIAALVLYRRWIEVRQFMQVRPSNSAAILVLLTSFSWFLASLVDVLIVQQVSLVLVLALTIVAVVGYRSAGLFAFPVALLVFVVPIWDDFVPYLQHFIANVVTPLLNLTGIPAVVEGTHVSVPAGTFDVRPACSGVNQLIVATMAGVLFSYAKRLCLGTAIWVVAAAAGVSVLTNTGRIYATVVIGQLSGMQHYFVTEHWAPGWILFGVGMFVFFLFAARWAERGRETVNARTSAGMAGGYDAGKAIQSAVLCLLALVSGPALVYAYQGDNPGIISRSLSLPSEIGAWHAAPAVPVGYRPVFQSPDLENERLYCDAQAKQVYLYVANYSRQEQGKEAVHVGNRVYDEETWRPVAARSLHLAGGGSVRETRVESTKGAQRVVWHWYYVHGFAVGNDMLAKLLNAWATLNRDPSITAVVVITDVQHSDDSAAAEAMLERFVSDARHVLEGAIDDLNTDLQGSSHD